MKTMKKFISISLCIILLGTYFNFDVKQVQGAETYSSYRGWILEEGKWYYYNGNGILQTGWKYINNSWYYLNRDGSMASGWLEDGGAWYYLGGPNDGSMKVGWQYIDGNWYYFNSSGARQTGWLLKNNLWYYLNENDGSMASGWLENEGEKYYLGMENDGSMKVGWQLIEGEWYYFRDSGSLIKGWILYNHLWYFLDTIDGSMETGWIEYNGVKYYLSSSGAMLVNTCIYEGENKYYLGADGAVVTKGWVHDEAGWYYLDDNSEIMTGWQYIDDCWYYLQSDGVMLTGWLLENGVWYYLNPNGSMETRAASVNGQVYVFNDSGVMYHGGNYTVRGCNFTASSSGAVTSCRILNFPVVMQRPELPTGCEVTSLTMLLNYLGYPVSKTTMASNYLPKVLSGYTGVVDIDYYFCGDPFKTSGVACGAGALVTATNHYFLDCGSSLRGIDISRSSVSSVYAYVSGGMPAVVMTTIGMANRKSATGWYTSSGKYVSYSANDHGMVLVGWDNTTVTVACPLLGIQTYNKAQFESVFLSRGNKAMIIR